MYIEEVEDYNIFQPKGVIVGSCRVSSTNAFRSDITTLEKDPLSAITNVLSRFRKETVQRFSSWCDLHVVRGGLNQDNSNTAGMK